MADIDKLTLEVESKAEKSGKGIDELVSSLTSLNTKLNSTSKGLKNASSSFDQLRRAAQGANSINFKGLQSSLTGLSNTVLNLNKSSGGAASFASGLKEISSSVNSLRTSFMQLKDSSSALNKMNLSGLESQVDTIRKISQTGSGTASFVTNVRDISSSVNGLRNAFMNLSKVTPTLETMDLSGLTKQVAVFKQMSQYADSFARMKEGAQSFSTAVNKLIKVSEKLPTLIKNVNDLDLTKFSTQVKTLSELLNTFASSINNVSSATKSFTSTVNTLPSSVIKTTNALTNTKNNTGFGGVNLLANLYMFKQIGDVVGGMIQKSNDYIETMNLFNVVMGESSRRASEFVSSLEVIGVDMEQAMRYQSSFYDIGKSLGMSARNAYTLSEQFTKLSYDYASLYNLPVEESFQKLQAAAVGTTEPIRRLGKDISVAKLEEIALSLGINESVRNMTQSEKATLRFIAVMQQSTSAMNDMERTINSPANSLRVLRAQFTSLARELGNLFIPMLTAVMPYLIALVRLLRDVAQAIASFFGVELPEIDFNSVSTSLGTADNYASDLADNLGSGADSAKKIRDYMLGIDELNVLDKDSGSSGGGSGGVGGIGGGGGDLGLDLEDFGYKTVLDQVKSKADEIYKSLQKWKPLLLTIAGILAGMWAIGKIAKFINALKTVQSAFKLVAGAKGIGGLVSAFFGLAGTGGILGTVSTAFVGLGDTILTSLGIITGSTTVAGLVGLAAVVGAVGLAVWGVVEALSPAIEQTNVFADVSSETKDKLEPVIDTWEELEKEINKLDFSSAIITDKDVQSITSKVSSMVDSVLSEVDADRNQALQDIELLKNAEGVSDETYQTIMNQTTSYYDGLTKETEDAENEIQAILNKASSEKRSLKEDEVKRLRQLEQTIRDNAVDTMSESEEEQMLIMTRLKHNTEALTVESASELLQEAKKNHDDQVAEAESWRERMLMELDQRFGDEATMSNEEYKKQYDAIQAAYDDQVDAANEGYDDINQAVKDKLGEQYDYIDESTGKIKSNLDRFLDKAAEDWNRSWSNVGTYFSGVIDGLGRWFGDIGSKVSSFLDEQKRNWDKSWSNLSTWFQGVINGIGNWMSGVYNKVTGWFSSIGREWTKFWNDPAGYIGGAITNMWNSITGRSRMASVDISYNDPGFTPSVMAFAGGGFVPTARNFVSPDMWTAGEAGKELIGSYQGRTTVMPLENTSFVSAMYSAIYQATRDAYGENEMTIIVQPKVDIGGKEIKQAEEEYTYRSGGGLIKKK